MSTPSSLILSVTQAETFDPEQPGGCPRRWYLERVEGRRVEKSRAHDDGDLGHGHLAHYLATGESPRGRVRMGKAVRGVIAAGRLPSPGPDLVIERRFDGQAKRTADGAWLPVDTAKTLWLGGVPWDGFVDLRYRRGPARAVWVWDHKFSSDIHAYARPAEKLIRTVQLPVYCLDSLRLWPDATVFQLVHHYVSRRGVDSFTRMQTVTLEQVLERKAEIEVLVQKIEGVAGAKSQEDVSFNRRACSAYMGCPHQSVCSGFRRKTVALSDDDLALFGMLEEKPGEKALKNFAAGVKERAATAPEALEPLAAQGPDAMADAAEAMHARIVGELIDSSFPEPVASTPAAQPPVCQGCGEALTRENASERGGVWKHIGCPADELGRKLPDDGTVAGTDAPRPQAAQCAACHHPAHGEKRCEAKRGKGTCRCGQVAAQQPERPQPPPAPTFASEGDDTGERDPELGADAPAVSAATLFPRTANTAAASWPVDDSHVRQSRPPQVSQALIPSEIRVTVTVELGPTTLAFLAGLVKR